MKRESISVLLFQLVFVIIVSIFSINMTGGSKEEKKDEPVFVELQENQGSFYAKIYYNETNFVEVKDLSFTGHTKIGGIITRDGARSELSFSEIKELDVTAQVSSNSQKIDDERYKISADEYLEAKIVTKSGIVVDKILIPRQVVICGEAVDTKIKKAWFLRDIKKIIIETPEEIKVEETKRATQKQACDDTGFFEKLKNRFRSISEILTQ